MSAIGKAYIFIEVEEQEHWHLVQEGIVYVCKNDRIFQLKCPCGCGEVIKCQLYPGNGSKPMWHVNENSIIPSIRRLSGCRSHFTITDGIVRNH